MVLKVPPSETAVFENIINDDTEQSRLLLKKGVGCHLSLFPQKKLQEYIFEYRIVDLAELSERQAGYIEPRKNV